MTAFRASSYFPFLPVSTILSTVVFITTSYLQHFIDQTFNFNNSTQHCLPSFLSPSLFCITYIDYTNTLPDFKLSTYSTHICMHAFQFPLPDFQRSVSLTKFQNSPSSVPFYVFNQSIITINSIFRGSLIICNMRHTQFLPLTMYNE